MPDGWQSAAGDCCRRFLDLGQYSSWDEEKRIAWLELELSGKRPLIPATMSMTPEVRLPAAALPPPHQSLLQYPSATSHSAEHTARCTSSCRRALSAICLQYASHHRRL